MIFVKLDYFWLKDFSHILSIWLGTKAQSIFSILLVPPLNASYVKFLSRRIWAPLIYYFSRRTTLRSNQLMHFNFFSWIIKRGFKMAWKTCMMPIDFRYLYISQTKKVIPYLFDLKKSIRIPIEFFPFQKYFCSLSQSFRFKNIFMSQNLIDFFFIFI